MISTIWAPDGDTVPVSVLKVFDGDGFLSKVELPGVDAQLAVRMGFIDAPEMDQPGGREAKAFLQNLIGRRRLDLAILMKMDTGRSFDRHGRIVAIPYLRTHRVGVTAIPTTASAEFRNIELEMVLNGWAWVMERYEPDPIYFEALEEAQRLRRGIWARDDNVNPWDFKAAQRTRHPRSPKSSNTSRNLFDLPTNEQPCQVSGCTGHLVQRQGRFGAFRGCSRFPECRYSTRGLS